MFLKKLLFRCGIIFVFISFLCITSLYGGKVVTHYNEKEIIHKEKQLDNYLIPVLEIPSLNFEKIILSDIKEIEINKNKISFYNGADDLEKINNIIIAGHNIKNVFGPLTTLKIGEKLILKTKQGSSMYKISFMNEISVLDKEYLYETVDKQITLITCTSDTQKRFVVIAKK